MSLPIELTTLSIKASPLLKNMVINLTPKIEDQLPAEMANLLQLAGEVARSHGWSLYLVGGVVRDLLLERTNLDLDLVVTTVSEVKSAENHNPSPIWYS